MGMPFRDHHFMQSGIPRAQASKSAIFFRGNACSQAGKIVLSIISKLYSQSEFGEDLTRNTGGPLQ